MAVILNLTQHPATPEQLEAGVVDLPEDMRARLVKLLTFDTLPTSTDVWARAECIANLAEVFYYRRPQEVVEAAMVGGAPYLMAPLERELIKFSNMKVVYAFSRRESVEEVQPDGSVRKTTVFRHAGFVPAVCN